MPYTRAEWKAECRRSLIEQFERVGIKVGSVIVAPHELRRITVEIQSSTAATVEIFAAESPALRYDVIERDYSGDFDGLAVPVFYELTIKRATAIVAALRRKVGRTGGACDLYIIPSARKLTHAFP